MPALVLSFLWVLLPAPALAHAAGESGWTIDLWSAGLLALSAGLYLAGFRRWRARRAALFWAGWAVVAAALLSPLYDLAEDSFTAHMLEHELLMFVAAPLLVASRPLGVLLAPLPSGARRGWGRFWAALTGPMVATALHGAALWVWHAPALFDATLTNRAVHALQHLSLFGTALLFWWAVLVGRGAAATGRAMLGLFVTALHSTLLAALMTLSPVPWYAYGYAYGGDPAAALADQQAAGLIMWVPGGLAYMGVALWLLARWLGGSEAARNSAVR